MTRNPKHVATTLWDEWSCGVGPSEDFGGLFINATRWNREVAKLVLNLNDIRELELRIDAEAAESTDVLKTFTEIRSFRVGVQSKTSFSFAQHWPHLQQLSLATLREAPSPAVVNLDDFRGCQELRVVKFMNIEVPEGIFCFCATRKELRSLDVGGRMQINGDIAQLGCCKQLVRLSCQSCHFGGPAEALAFIRDSSVSRLDLTFTNIDDSYLEVIATSSALEHLALQNSNVTGAGLQYLSTLPALSFVSVDSRALTLEGARHLSACKQLREIWLMEYEERIDEGALTQLRKSLADCELRILSRFERDDLEC